jgi:hypothetical protein
LSTALRTVGTKLLMFQTSSRMAAVQSGDAQHAVHVQQQGFSSLQCASIGHEKSLTRSFIAKLFEGMSQRRCNFPTAALNSDPRSVKRKHPSKRSERFAMLGLLGLLRSPQQFSVRPEPLAGSCCPQSSAGHQRIGVFVSTKALHCSNASPWACRPLLRRPYYSVRSWRMGKQQTAPLRRCASTARTAACFGSRPWQLIPYRRCHAMQLDGSTTTFTPGLFASSVVVLPDACGPPGTCAPAPGPSGDACPDPLALPPASKAPFFFGTATAAYQVEVCM